MELEVKQPTTYEQQEDKLRSRGCIIDDPALCIQKLKEINYYRFTAYFISFWQENDHDKYIPGTSFTTVYNIYEFAGILFCKCGKALTMKVQKGADGNMSSRFYCANLRNCGTSSCMCNEIVEKVSDTLKQAIQDFTVMLDSGDKESIKRHTARIKILETKLQDLEKREMALWEAQADPDLSVRMPNHIFLALNDKIVKEREQTTLMLEQTYASMPNPKLYRENIQRFSDAVEALNSPEVPAAIKNKLLKACIERIEYSKPKAERIKSSSKRIWVNGHRIRTNPLPTGGNWTSPEISLDIKLRV